MPLVAKYFSVTRERARQLEAKKLTMLAQEGLIPLPTVYGVVMTQANIAGPDEMLLIERLRGVSAEAPTRTPERWEQLKRSDC